MHGKTQLGVRREPRHERLLNQGVTCIYLYPSLVARDLLVMQHICRSSRPRHSHSANDDCLLVWRAHQLVPVHVLGGCFVLHRLEFQKHG